MSLGTGALKVGWEPERLKHSKEVSCRREPLLHAATNWNGHTEGIQWKILTLPHTYQHTNPQKNGREGLGARIYIDLL